MKKIAIAGTHGVGKTTLAYSLMKSSNYDFVVVNSQIARTLIRNGYPLGKEATVESYIQYIIAQLRAEQEVEKCDLFISDRTLLDPLAYAIVNRKYAKSEVSTSMKSIIELLKRVWLLELQQYDMYVFVPIEFPMQSDGIRPEDEEYRAKVEEQMVLLLDENCVNHITVSGSVEERNAQVHDALRSLDRE